MNIRKDTTSFIYLGSCLRLGHGGVGDAEGLIQRSGKKFAGWNGSYLSPMGRKILIQPVISAPAKLLDGSSGFPQEKWSPPSEGFVKLNFHGTVNPIIEAIGIGGIVRDSKGEVKIAYSCLMGISHPLEAELKALHQGVFLCIRNGFKKVIIEGSCLILVESLGNAKKLSGEFMQLWSALMDGLKNMERWGISFCRQSQNKIANQLAKISNLHFLQMSISCTNRRKFL
ncbi:hypothetical protein AAC387_Pa09g0774 [Persea americana]